MNFGEMIAQLQDRTGYTGQEALLARMLNRGKDRYVHASKWPHLEASTTQLFTSGTRLYSLPDEVLSVIALEGPDGTRLDGDLDRDTYDDLYRADTATATVPKVYVLQGNSTSRQMQMHVHPNPASNTAGTVRYLRQVPDIASVSTTLIYHQIPESHHFNVLDFAEAELYLAQNDPRVQIAEQKAVANAMKLAGQVAVEVQEDNT